MKIWLDDVRTPPDGFVWAKTADEAIYLLDNHRVTEISLDHDLGDPEYCGTGYDVMLEIEQDWFVDGKIPPIIHIHTANVAARIRMEQARDSINAACKDTA